MNKEQITQLSKWLKIAFASDSPHLKVIDASIVILMKNDATEEQTLEAIDNVEVIYTQNKLKYAYVERRLIEKSLSKIKGNQTIKVFGKAIKTATVPVIDKAIRPAYKNVVLPATAAVGGFFKGLFSSK